MLEPTYSMAFSPSNLSTMGLEKTLRVKVDMSAAGEAEGAVSSILDQLELQYHVRYQT